MENTPGFCWTEGDTEALRNHATYIWDGVGSVSWELTEQSGIASELTRMLACLWPELHCSLLVACPLPFIHLACLSWVL